MKIVKVTPITGEIIEIEGRKYAMCCERYGPDCWFVRMGESLEPVYDPEKLEKAHQEHKRLEGGKPE